MLFQQSFFLLRQKDFPLSSINGKGNNQHEDGLHLEFEKHQKLGTKSILVYCKFVDKYCYKNFILRAGHEKSKRTDEVDL